MNIDTLKDVPKVLWLLLMAAGFIFFWPLGLAVLVWLVVTGRLGQRVNLSFGGFDSSFWTSSGNKAFDQYRDDVLDKLRKEREGFDQFLVDLAKAKDKAEFDQFMAQRKG